MGGVHPAQEKSLSLDTLGLKVGEDYSFDFFYCERHTTESVMQITTNLLVKCPAVDYCGVCRGNGSDCCQPSDCKGSEDKCKIFTCPQNSKPGVTSANYKEMCDFVEKVCEPKDICHVAECMTLEGSCKQKPRECPNRTDECLHLDGCFLSTPNGCNYTTQCDSSKNLCYTGACNGGFCVPVDCDRGDKCKIYTCDEHIGCQMKDKCVPSSACMQSKCSIDGQCSEEPISNCKECDCEGKLNKCQVKSCNSAAECVPLPLDIDDGNPCTNDTCSEENGVTHTPLDCGVCGICNIKNGTCQENLVNCNDGNICTTELCGSNGQCLHLPVSCEDNNKCTIDTCDPFKGGCQHTLVKCPDLNQCQIGYCDKDKGCLYKPRECQSDFFCIESACDDVFGCMFFDKECVADNPRCQKGICNNETRECTSKDYDPAPFICSTAKVVSTSVIAGVTVAGAAALGLAIFGGKKGYDYWKDTQGDKISMANSNPLYEAKNANGGENPLYTAD